MLWQVKLSYCINLDAPTKLAAHEKAVKMMKTTPEAFISKIEDARYSGHKSLWRRFLLGGR